MTRFSAYVKIYLVLIASFAFLCILSCLIPSQKIKNNISKSAKEFMEDGTYPSAIIQKKACQLDKFTDAIILNQIFSIDQDNLFFSFIAVPSYMEASPTQSLYKVTKKNIPYNNHYSRYWHGSTFFFRPFFLFTDYKGIQEILYIISSIIFVIFIILLNKNTNWLKTLSVILSFSLIYGFVTQFSIQFFPIWSIALITCCLVLIKKYSPRQLYLTFFIVGSVTCFFDLLTTPLISWGLPLLIYFTISESNSFFELTKKSIMTGFTWCCGYLLTWISKWGLTLFFLGKNAFINTLKQVQYRSSAIDFNRFQAIPENFKMLNTTFLLIVLGCSLLLVIIGFSKKGIQKSLAYLLIASSPFLWFFVVANHSYMHFWFTYRLLILFLLGSLFAFNELTSFENIKIRFSKCLFWRHIPRHKKRIRKQRVSL